MQVYLFQEREHVLRLYSENDRLKIRCVWIADWVTGGSASVHYVLVLTQIQSFQRSSQATLPKEGFYEIISALKVEYNLSGY